MYNDAVDTGQDSSTGLVLASLFGIFLFSYMIIDACLMRVICKKLVQYLEEFNRRSDKNFDVQLITNATVGLKDGIGCLYGELCTYKPLGLRIVPRK
jgi:hypothetical protein